MSIFFPKRKCFPGRLSISWSCSGVQIRYGLFRVHCPVVKHSELKVPLPCHALHFLLSTMSASSQRVSVLATYGPTAKEVYWNVVLLIQASLLTAGIVLPV